MRKKILSMFLVFIMILSQISSSVFAVKANDYDNSWAKESIAEFLEKGFINRYSDGTFRPKQNITRIEFVQAINRAFDIPDSDTYIAFSDINSLSPYYGDVKKGKAYGYIDGYSDGTFRPENSITREEAAKIIGVMLGIDGHFRDVLSLFKDNNQIGEWAKKYVNFLVSKGVINGYPDGTFKGNNNITREEAITILNRIYKDATLYTGIQFTAISEGLPIENVNLKIYSKSNKLIKEGTTNINGMVDIKALDLGEYTIIAEDNDNSRLFIQNVIVRDGFVTYIESKLQKSIKVEGILVDQYGDKAPKGMTLVFEGENKHINQTLNNGVINISLLPNSKYKVYLKQDTLELIGEIEVGDKDKNIGTLKYKNKTAKVSIREDYRDPKEPQVPQEPQVPKDDKTPPVITLNTKDLEHVDLGKDLYIAGGKLDSLNGIIKDDSEITKLEYSIDYGNLNIIRKDMNPSKAFTIDNPQLLVGQNTITIKATDSKNNVGICTIEILNTSEENSEGIILDEDDNDGDGLLNYQEIYYVTDPNNPDTDGDGLTDYEEIMILSTDPLKQDTDGNGILDPDEDFDNDGLTNIEELRLNGNPFNADTDYDGLEDGEEIRLGTKIDEWDTDEDGLSDGKEIELGTNPLNPDTNGNGILDGDEKYHVNFTSIDVEPGDVVIPSVSLDVAGSYMDTIAITKVDEDDIFLSNDIPGYIDNAFDFMIPDNFDNATIYFDYNGNVPISEDFLPTLYYFNEDTQELEELTNQWINGNIITAEVSHFSKYILLNKIEFDKVWEVEIRLPNEDEEGNIKPLDIILVIDSSGSMDWNDPEYIRKLAAKEFVNKLGDNDQAAIVDFDDYATLLSGLTSNKSILHDAIDMIDSWGGTAIYEGFSMALSLFSDINYNYSISSYRLMGDDDVISTILDKRELEEQLSGELPKELPENLPEELPEDMSEDIPEELLEELPEELQEELPENLPEELSEDMSEDIPEELQEELPEEYEDMDIVFMAESLFAVENRDANRYIVILTDGEDNYSYNYNSLIQSANTKGVTVYTIGLGYDVDVSLLRGIAEGTGGKYYHATTYDDLDDIFDETAGETIDFVTDSNNDGISDYYTQKIYEGVLKTGNGKSFSGIDFSKNADYDNDGLKNGEELKVIVSGKKVYLHMYSDPTKADTDGDGYNDKEDLDPLRKYKTPIILLHGRGDNTDSCFGVQTNVKIKQNSHYDTSRTAAGLSYYHVNTHEIIGFTKVWGLGFGLSYDAGYEKNYNMFAFNYPNQDMAQHNADKLRGYIFNIIQDAKSNNSGSVKASGIFATKSDLANNNYKFDLIGHSNGGLVSRYYIENLDGDKNIRKLITLNTPHYGSGIAYLSSIIDISDTINDCYPMDVELSPSSTLFGGSKKTFISIINKERAKYINENQSPKLEGNFGVSTTYYAIGGYDAGLDEIIFMPRRLHDTQFMFDFNSRAGKLKDFNNNIRKAAQKIDSKLNLFLYGYSGDNVVNIRSQFGVRDSSGNIIERIYFHKTSLNVDTVSGHGPINHFHGQNQNNRNTIKKVIEYLND